MLTKVCTFSREKAAGIGSESFQAAELLADQDADPLTIAGALLAPFVWQGQVEPAEISIHFGQTLAVALKNLISPFILRLDTENHRRGDIHSMLASLDGHPCKAVVPITFLRILPDAIMRVNGKNAGLNCPLRDGDSLEIAENKKQTANN